jgi:hypothetical protein
MPALGFEAAQLAEHRVPNARLALELGVRDAEPLPVVVDQRVCRILQAPLSAV